MMSKEKRIFYYHEGVGAFIPYEKDNFENYFEGYDGDKFEVEFMIKFMTDEEFENLPEAD